MPVKLDADVIAARPGISTWPGDSRLGIVSLRLSCAVKPLAAQAATPSEPLPSGSDCEPAVFGWPRKTSDRDTTPPVLTEKAPFCHAVVPEAADAAGALPTVATRTVATARKHPVA
ncbi:MAG TPA: hypothetical protein VIC62_05660, partial [Nakamurella sp.]